MNPHGMTIAELIHELSALPGDAKVLISATNSDEVPESMLVVATGDIVEVEELIPMGGMLAADASDELRPVDEVIVELPVGRHVILWADRYTSSPLELVFSETDDQT